MTFSLTGANNFEFDFNLFVIKRFAVKAFDCCFCFVTFHFHKPKSPAFSSKDICYQIDRTYLAKL